MSNNFDSLNVEKSMSPKTKKNDISSQLSPIHQLNSKNDLEENELINIIQLFSGDTIKDEELQVLQQKLLNFPQNLIPSNISPVLIFKIFEKYRDTKNLLEENCLILIIECLSLIDNYFPIFEKCNFFNITIGKVANLSPNSILMLKLLANIYDSLENKDDSLRSICSLFPIFFANSTNINFTKSNNQIFDHMIHFIYNYSNSKFVTEVGSKLIYETLILLFQNCEINSMILSSFSIERIFYIIKELILKSGIDFTIILNHPIINNKNHYLFNSNDDMTTAYMILSAVLFNNGLNPFNLHIYDFIPFLKSQNKTIISTSIWILGIMISSSSEMRYEFQNIKPSAFEEIYNDIDYNGKIEMAYLYQNLLDGINNNEYFQFILDNSDMLFQFFDLENEEILSHMIHFLFDTYNTIIIEGDEEKLIYFIKILYDHDFKDTLENIISESQSNDIQLYSKKLSSILQAEEETTS